MSDDSPERPGTAEREFVAGVTRKLEEELRGWKGDGHREWDRVAMQMNPAHEFNAEVLRLPTGHYLIALCFGMPAALRTTLRALFSNDEFLLVRWRKKTKRGWRQESENLRVLADRARDGSTGDNRMWLAEFLSLTATRFIFYHELAHVVRGHLYHDWTLRGRRATCAYSEAGFAAGTPKFRHLWRLFEIDADVVGSDFFARFTALSTWQQLDGRTRRQLCSLCMFAVGLSLLLLDQQQKRLALSCGVHQSPFVRFLIVLDILGGAFRRELKLNAAQLRRAARVAVGCLAQAAKHMRMDTRVWNVADRSAWQRALGRQARLLRRHQREMTDLLGPRRSTFLPSETDSQASQERGP